MSIFHQPMSFGCPHCLFLSEKLNQGHIMAYLYQPRSYGILISTEQVYNGIVLKCGHIEWKHLLVFNTFVNLNN